MNVVVDTSVILSAAILLILSSDDFLTAVGAQP